MTSGCGVWASRRGVVADLRAADRLAVVPNGVDVDRVRTRGIERYARTHDARALRYSVAGTQHGHAEIAASLSPASSSISPSRILATAPASRSAGWKRNIASLVEAK